jgi:hypothetical protein
MTPVHALSVISLVLGQAAAAPAATPGGADGAAPPPQTAQGAPPPQTAQGAPAAQAAQGGPGAQAPAAAAQARPAAAPRPRLVPEGAPALRLERTTRCFDRGDGARWRAQCDALTKTCLVAPDAELASDGEARGDLERAPACVTPGWREDDLAGQGYRMLPALAETPPGWRRDDRQRLMQVTFDLNRRVWLGAGWAGGDFPWSKQGLGEAGVRWDVPFRWAGAPAIARFRALETAVAFDGKYAELTAFGVDVSRAYPSPLLHLTTFVGAPRRFDVNLDVGGWLEAVHLETVRTASHRWFDRLSLGSAALTLDLWRSRDLGSFLRLRGGGGYETADQLGGGAWVPLAAADLESVLDRGGFHNLRAGFVAEWVRPAGASRYQPKDPNAPLLPQHRRRLTGKVEYEWIFLAVNDQPLSLVLEGRAQQRDDVPDLPTRWLFQGTAAMRFSLFAPARRNAAVQEAL